MMTVPGAVLLGRHVVVSLRGIRPSWNLPAGDGKKTVVVRYARQCRQYLDGQFVANHPGHHGAHGQHDHPGYGTRRCAAS